MAAFRRHAGAATGRSFPDYDSLHAWSIDEPAAFWRIMAEHAHMRFERNADQVLQRAGDLPGAVWFEGARLNYADNLLQGADDKPALVAYLESGERKQITFGDLRARVSGCASVLRSQGVGPGDRVAGWLPNVIETVVAVLATASVGAVWSSCSPDFGAAGAMDRFGQIQPKVLIACDGYRYAGKVHHTAPKVIEVADNLEARPTVLWVHMVGPPQPSRLDLNDLIDAAAPGNPAYHACAFDDPLFILYSSGTTGRPKCIVHGVGGTLLQHLKEHQLHTDLRSDDVLFFFTTCGWMMWNWLVSGLATGATVVLYDGSPVHPSPTVLLDLAAREGVTQFGASAKYLQVLENAGVRPIDSHDLSSVRMWLSTGSPLAPAGFEYVYQHVKRDVCLASISGGTDIISCFVLGNPELPVHAGEIQCRGLGMAVDVWDDAGRPVTGTRGELVCTRAFPSCPLGFWDDPDQIRFRAAYFERFPGVWAHGDFAEITPHGGIVIHGRSDAVLNPGGVRIGTAEIYRQVETLPEVAEAVCVAQEWADDVRVVLFLVLTDGAALTPELTDEIRRRIRENASPRHVPARILAVTDIPRTMSGKIAELAVRDIIHGRPVANTAALANPEALSQFDSRPELAT